MQSHPRIRVGKHIIPLKSDQNQFEVVLQCRRDQGFISHCFHDLQTEDKKSRHQPNNQMTMFLICSASLLILFFAGGKVTAHSHVSRWLPTDQRHLRPNGQRKKKRGRQAAWISEKHPKFSDALLAELYTKDENQFTSTWGVSMMYSLLYPGSTGKSMDQMRAILGFPRRKRQLVWNNTVSRLNAAYDGRCMDYNDESEECYDKRPTLQVANSVWIDDGSALESRYQGVVGSYARQTNFNDDGAGDVVNDWVKNSTNGVIESIIDDGKIDAALLAINAIYLYALWLDPFEEENTKEDTFYSSASRDDSTGKAHFMHMVSNFDYSEDAVTGYQMILLPYMSSKLSMIIALPTSDANEMVSTEAALSALPKLKSTRVALAFPKFKFETEYEETLESSLEALGLAAPFDPSTEDLCDTMVDGKCLYLDVIKQKAFINVNEKGTEAAAVTVGIMKGTSMGPEEDPVLYMADHPFQFFIYDGTEDLVVFEGQVVNPGIPGGSTSSTSLKHKHANSKFWCKNFDVLCPSLSRF